MNSFGVRAKARTNIAILDQFRAEQGFFYVLEYILGYHFNELEELRPHKKDIRFMAESDYNNQPDLAVLSHWLDRERNVEDSIEKNEKIITKVYDKLYARIILKMLEGEKLKPLDIFFYHLKKYINKIRAGKVTLRESVEQYDWEHQQFKD